jgi:hypothetical protein
VYDPDIEAIVKEYGVSEGDDGSISEVPDEADAEIESGTHRVPIDGSNWPSAMVT